METKTYKVTYTTRVGKENVVIVKALDEQNALDIAKRSVYTGSFFRNPVITNDNYVTPFKQGFKG